MLAAGDAGEGDRRRGRARKCDLIAMATHGHKLIGDLMHGSVANDVRHQSMIPVLLVRHRKDGEDPKLGQGD